MANRWRGPALGVAAAVAVSAGHVTARAQDDALLLPPVTVEATGETERGDGPVQGYRATRSTTATRTDTPILETPASISVVPRDVIRDLNALTPAQVLRVVPSVAQRQNFQGTEAFTIRGLFTDDDNGFQLDGLRTRNLLQFDPFLFERVEVLKGPAALLYGANEPGGVVNYTSLRPTLDPFVSGGVEVGTYNDVRGTVDGSYSLDNGIGVRLPVAARRYDTFRDHVDDNKSLGLLPSIDVPIGERTRARLVAGYFYQEVVDDTVMIPLLGGEPADIDKSTFLGIPDAKQEDRLFQSVLTVEHEFNDAVRLRNALSYLRTRSDQDTVANVTGVNPDGTFDPFRVRGDEDFDSLQNQAELHLTGSLLGVGHQGLIGVDVGRREEDLENNGELLVTEDIFDPANDPTVAVPDFGFVDYGQDFRTDLLGVYAQDQVTLLRDRPLAHRVIAVLGGRWDWYRQQTDHSGLLFGSTTPDSDVDKSQFSPRLGAVWMPIDRLSLYGSWSRSFAPQEITTLDDTPPEPQEAEQFEVGVKVEPLERAQLTLSLFDITKENVPGPSLDGVTTELIGKERSRGLELDLSGEILPGWQAFGGYAYVKATVDESEDDTEGNDLFDAPRHRFTLWSGYTQPSGPLEGLGGGAGVFFTGDSYADNANDTELGSFTLVDAALWYRPGKRFFEVAPALQVGVRNLFDEDYYLGGNGFNSVEPGAPRTFYASLQLTF